MPQSSLKARFMRASSWVAAGYLVSNLMRLCSNLLTTRLLEPNAFGLTAIATIVVVVVALMSDIGIRQSIIQRKEENRADFLNTAWTLQAIRGVAMWFMAMTLAGVIYLANRAGLVPAGSTYADPILPAVICVSSLSAIFLGLQSTKAFTAGRELNLKRLTQNELLGQFVTIIVMVTLAWFTHSVWSVVVGGLAGSLTSMMLSHLRLPGLPNRFHWDKGAAKELMKFGRWFFVSSAIGVFASNGDRLLLGGFVDADALGIYAVALTLAGLVNTVIGKLFASVALPAFSEIARQSPQRLRPVYWRIRRMADTVLLLVAGFLCASGQSVADILYNERYAGVGPILQILSFSLLFTRYAISHHAYVALGKPKYMVALNVMMVVSIYTTIPAAYHLFGFWGAVVAIAVREVATLPFIFYFNAKHGLNDVKHEILVLLVWPAGYLLGQGLNLAYAAARPYFS